jgi:hypothetical protein
LRELRISQEFNRPAQFRAKLLRGIMICIGTQFGIISLLCLEKRPGIILGMPLTNHDVFDSKNFVAHMVGSYCSPAIAFADPVQLFEKHVG